MKLLFVCFSLAFAMQAQTLSLGTATAGMPGSAIRVPLVLSGVSSPLPASLQWTMVSPSAVKVIAGPSAIAAGKSIGCNTIPGISTLVNTKCVVMGLNNTGMNNGVVAYLDISLTDATTRLSGIEITEALGSGPFAENIPIQGIGGRILARTSPPPRDLPSAPGRGGQRVSPAVQNTTVPLTALSRAGQPAAEIWCGKTALKAVGDEITCSVSLKPSLQNERNLGPFTTRDDLAEAKSVWAEAGASSVEYKVRLIKDPEVTAESFVLTGLTFGERTYYGVVWLAPPEAAGQAKEKINEETSNPR